MNNLNKTTKFSVTSYDRTTTIEVDHCDVDMEEFLDIVKVLAIGMTFHEDTFKRGIIELGAQYEEEMREEDVYRPDPTLEKSVDDYFRNLSEKEIDEALAEHNADEDADWDVTLNDGLENDGWTPELEQQFWAEQPPEPFATPEELSRDGGFDGIPIKVEKKKKKDAKRK
jgi:hypothetical protein